MGESTGGAGVSPAADRAETPSRDTGVRWLVLTGALLILAALVVGLGLWRGRGLTNGPIEAAPNTTLAGIQMDRPGTVTWGDTVVRNTTKSPVTLRSATLGGGLDGTAQALRVVTVEVADPQVAHAGIGLMRGDGLGEVAASARHPLSGFVLEPGRDAELLVRLDATAKGAWRYDYVDIVYETAGQRYRVRMPQAVGACVQLVGACDVGKPPGL